MCTHRNVTISENGLSIVKLHTTVQERQECIQQQQLKVTQCIEDDAKRPSSKFTFCHHIRHLPNRMFQLAETGSQQQGLQACTARWSALDNHNLFPYTHLETISFFTALIRPNVHLFFLPSSPRLALSLHSNSTHLRRILFRDPLHHCSLALWIVNWPCCGSSKTWLFLPSALAASGHSRAPRLLSPRLLRATIALAIRFKHMHPRQ